MRGLAWWACVLGRWKAWQGVAADAPERVRGEAAVSLCLFVPPCAHGPRGGIVRVGRAVWCPAVPALAHLARPGAFLLPHTLILPLAVQAHQTVRGLEE